MKKVHVRFVDQSGFEENPISEHVLKFEDDDVTDQDVTDEIAKIEDQSLLVCEHWEWMTGANNQLIAGAE